MTCNKYYITYRPFSEGSYYLHTCECPFGGEEKRRTLIGFFDSADDAINACLSMGLNVKECHYCLGYRHNKNKPEETADGRFLFSCMVYETPESAMVCSVN